MEPAGGPGVQAPRLASDILGTPHPSRAAWEAPSGQHPTWAVLECHGLLSVTLEFLPSANTRLRSLRVFPSQRVSPLPFCSSAPLPQCCHPAGGAWPSIIWPLVVKIIPTTPRATRQLCRTNPSSNPCPMGPWAMMPFMARALGLGTCLFRPPLRNTEYSGQQAQRLALSSITFSIPPQSSSWRCGCTPPLSPPLPPLPPLPSTVAPPLTHFPSWSTYKLYDAAAAIWKSGNDYLYYHT